MNDFMKGISYARFVISRSASPDEVAKAVEILDDLIRNLTTINSSGTPENIDRAQLASLSSVLKSG